MQNVEHFIQLKAALESKRASLEIFGEKHPEGIRVRQSCFCPETGEKKDDKVFAVAFLDIVEAKYRAERQIAALTEGLSALEDFVKRLGKADLVGDGVQKLKQKDIEAILADLTEKLPKMVPGLP
jgi:hypothetical protein